MTTLEIIVQHVQGLPATLQQEALHYIEYLKQRQDSCREDSAWTHGCSSQMVEAYGPDDAIYDSE